MITTDLGLVTAYAEAVAQGYTGTKEEFGKLLANYAKTAEKVAEDKAAAEQAMESAKESADRASTSEQNAKASEDAVVQKLADVKTEVDAAVEAGKKSKTNLDKSIADSTKAKTALDESIKSANGSKSALDKTVEQANVLDESLGSNIVDGTQLNKDITASGNKAVADINSASEKALEDINTTGTAKLDAVNKAAESIVADREQIAKNKTDIASLNEDLGDVIDKQENLWTYGDVVNSYKANAQYQSKYYDIQLDDGEYYIQYDNAVGAVAGNAQIFPYGKDKGVLTNIIPPSKSGKFSPKNGGVRIYFFSTLTNVAENDGVSTWSGIKLVKGTNIVSPSIKESALPDFYKTLPIAIPKIEEEKANGKGISFSINESGGLRVTYDDGK